LANLADAAINTLDDVRSHSGQLVMFSKETMEKNRQLKGFLYDRLYRHYKVERMRIKAERFLTRIFESYMACPTLLPVSYQERFVEHGMERVICDYVAGMTDRYAQDEYKRLFEPFERV
jgi:dGTPase